MVSFLEWILSLCSRNEKWHALDLEIWYRKFSLQNNLGKIDLKSKSI
jgi:hypothetical protein